MEECQRSNWGKFAGVFAMAAGFALGAIVAWIYWTGRREQAESPTEEVVETPRLTLEPAPVVPVASPSAQGVREPDDLTRIEGIGPKISALLQEAGVTTFGQLARRDPGVLEDVLRDEGLPFVDPTTWPEQATLAAAGAWEALAELQEALSGGRRVA